MRPMRKPVDMKWPRPGSSGEIGNPCDPAPVSDLVNAAKNLLRRPAGMPPPASSRGFIRSLLLCCAAALLGQGVPHAQMVPDAPIENFRLPMFGDDGYRAWDLRGDQALYISANQVDVLGMLLHVYAGGAEERVRIRIESAEAHVHIDRNEAHGDKRITVSGDNYTAKGEEWSWLPDDDRILIRRNVQVTFREELEGFLMPLP